MTGKVAVSPVAWRAASMTERCADEAMATGRPSAMRRTASTAPGMSGAPSRPKRATTPSTMARSMSAAGTSRDRRSRIVRDHAVAHTGARVINYELSALSEDHLAEILAIRHEFDVVVRDVIDRGVAAGAFTTPDTRMTALAILSLGIDVARWYRDGGRWTPDEVAAHYRLLALRMVGVSD